MMTLYKRDTTGEIRQWSMELDGDRYRSISGRRGGKLTTSGWTKAWPKNVGRSNETSPEQQAKLEVNAEYRKKLDQGYFYDIGNIDKVHFTKPMLAKTWDGSITQGYAQPKLDGIRCIARADGLWTRTGKPIRSLTHIRSRLTRLFEDKPHLILDGELYNHELKDDFNQITSLVRKDKATAEAEALVQYHVYDLVDTSLNFEDRLQLLRGIQGVHQVSTHYFTGIDTLDALYAEWLDEGYEGQMIRADRPYEPGKRSKTLLKRKEFLSDEFSVVAVEEGVGNWSGFAKRFRVSLPDGRVFGAGVRGTQPAMKALLEGPLPVWATVRYFTPTPDGIPRFPVVVDWGFDQKRSD